MNIHFDIQNYFLNDIKIVLKKIKKNRCKIRIRKFKVSFDFTVNYEIIKFQDLKNDCHKSHVFLKLFLFFYFIIFLDF